MWDYGVGVWGPLKFSVLSSLHHLISCIWEDISAERGLLREYHYFLFEHIIPNIHTLRGLSLRGPKAIFAGSKGGLGGFVPQLYY